MSEKFSITNGEFLDFMIFLKDYKVSYYFDSALINVIFDSELTDKRVIMNIKEFDKNYMLENIRFLKQRFGFEEE